MKQKTARIRISWSSLHLSCKQVQEVLKGNAGMAGQMRLSGYNIIPFDLHQPNAPLNPFIPSSCDKHLSFPRPLRLRDLTNFQGMLSIHRLGRQARKKRIEWSKRNKKRCIIERKTERGREGGEENSQ